MVYNGTAYEVKWSAQRDLIVGKSLAGSRLLMATLGGNTKTLLPVSELPCILSLIQ